eukprot:4064181-Pleurochrysis_carterae.AAC.1
MDEREKATRARQANRVKGAYTGMVEIMRSGRSARNALSALKDPTWAWPSLSSKGSVTSVTKTIEKSRTFHQSRR